MDYQEAMKPIFQAQADLRSWFTQQFELLEEAERVIALKKEPAVLRKIARFVNQTASELESALSPSDASRCWGKGAAFALAMNHARRITEKCADALDARQLM